MCSDAGILESNLTVFSCPVYEEAKTKIAVLSYLWISNQIDRYLNFYGQTEKSAIEKVVSVVLTSETQKNLYR